MLQWYDVSGSVCFRLGGTSDAAPTIGAVYVDVSSPNPKFVALFSV